MKRERMRSIVKGGTEDVRSNPATAGLPLGVYFLFSLVSAEAMPKFYCASASNLNMNTTTSFEKGTIGETVYIDLSTV